MVAVGDYSTVEKGLIEEHWDPNVRNKDDVTPAHKAAERNDLKMLKLLHSAGANLDVTDGFGTTPLFYAKENRSPSKVGPYNWTGFSEFLDTLPHCSYNDVCFE